MYKKIIVLLVLASLAVTANAGKNGSLKLENRLRVATDDNVYSADESTAPDSVVDSVVISDQITLTGKINFSARSDFMVYYQPEVRYFTDADPEIAGYHNLYAELNHAISQIISLTVADRLKYQDKEGQSDLMGAPGVDLSFLENEVQGALDFLASSRTSLKVSGAYQFRTWDDSNYGENNDYEQIRADAKIQQELKPSTTYGFAGASYTDVSYDNDLRGGYEAVNVYLGLGHTFSPVVSGNIQGGYTLATVDKGDGTENDNDTPFIDAGLEYKASDKTTVTASGGYSVSRSGNRVFNVQDKISGTVGLKHDLTGKLSVSFLVSYILSQYDVENVTSLESAPEDVADAFIKARARISYQVNRNNFLEAGYEYSQRDGDDFFGDYDRNRADIGWRLTL